MIAVAISLLVSHKFAGPIFKLEKSIKEIYNGNLTYKMYLRAGDELKSLSDYFNSMTDRFRQWVESDRRITREVINKLEEIKNKLDRNEIKEEIGGIQSKLEEVTKNWKIKD